MNIEALPTSTHLPEDKVTFISIYLEKCSIHTWSQKRSIPMMMIFFCKIIFVIFDKSDKGLLLYGDFIDE